MDVNSIRSWVTSFGKRIKNDASSNSAGRNFSGTMTGEGDYSTSKGEPVYGDNAPENNDDSEVIDGLSINELKGFVSHSFETVYLEFQTNWNEETVRWLNLLKPGEPYDRIKVEARARSMVDEVIAKAEAMQGKKWSLLREFCATEDELWKTVCALANTYGGIVHLSLSLSRVFEDYLVKPLLETADPPMLFTLRKDDGLVLFVSPVPGGCLLRDGRMLRRIAGRNVEIGSTGEGLDFRKRARGEELCLGVHHQAAALARLFLTNGEEFCLALFGPWGRGKTELAHLLQERLEEEGYQFIHFSAWRHPATPELWAHLYETFVEAAHTRTPLLGFPVTLRTLILRYGLWPALPILALIGWGWSSMGMKWKLIDFLWSLLGATGAFLLLRLWRSRALLTSLLERYARLPRHEEKLGLQSAIGHDLKALLEGWFPFGVWGFSGLGKNLALFLFLLLGGGVGYVLCPKTFSPPDIWTLHNTVAVITTWAPVSLWNLLLFLFVTLPMWPNNARWKPWVKRRRLLLVVDDLDRCDPATMLHVMESLKLLLEGKEIQRRLQVLMLVDEQILYQAIVEKYERLVKASAANPRFHPHRVVRENVEKLFTGHFRLLPLSTGQIDSVVERYVPVAEKSQPGPAAHPGSVPPLPNRGEPPVEKATTSFAGFSEPSLSLFLKGYTKVSRHAGVKKSILLQTMAQTEKFTREDQVQLAEYIRRLHEGGFPVLGPRSVRYLLNGYQLARHLARQMEQQVQPDSLKNALLEAHLGSMGTSEGAASPLLTIARHVSWPVEWKAAKHGLAKDTAHEPTSLKPNPAALSTES